MMAKRVSARKTTFREPKSAIKARVLYDQLNQSFPCFELLRFYSAMAILERQVYLVVEQFGAENISLLSGRLVFNSLELTK